MNYIIITTAKNESKNIAKCIDSVLKQSILPIVWYIVNDNSDDDTAKVIEHYCKLHSWIKLINKNFSDNKEYGANIVEAFHFGMKHINNTNYNFVCNLDADIVIDSNKYYETLIYEFVKDKDNGILSGVTYYIKNGQKKIVSHNPWVTTGALKMYRRECFEQLGGPKPVLSWDGLDDYRAISRGWKTKTFFDLTVHHLGKYKSINRQNSLDWYWVAGKSLYQRGYSGYYCLAKTISLFVKGHFKRGFVFCLAYFEAKRKKLIIYATNDEIKTIRHYQKKNINRFLNLSKK